MYSYELSDYRIQINNDLQSLAQKGFIWVQDLPLAEIRRIQGLWNIFEDNTLQGDDRANLSEQLNTEANPVPLNMFLDLDPRLN